jgi:hypothetical protein
VALEVVVVVLVGLGMVVLVGMLGVAVDMVGDWAVGKAEVGVGVGGVGVVGTGGAGSTVVGGPVDA